MGGNMKKSIVLPRVIIAGTLVMLFVTGMLLLLLTGLVINERVEEQSGEKMLLLIWALAGACVGICGNRIEDQKKLYVSLGMCMLFACVMLVGGMLFFEGRVTKPWLPIGVMTGGCVVYNVFCARVSWKRKHKIRSR